MTVAQFLKSFRLSQAQKWAQFSWNYFPRTVPSVSQTEMLGEKVKFLS